MHKDGRQSHNHVISTFAHKILPLVFRSRKKTETLKTSFSPISICNTACWLPVIMGRSSLTTLRRDASAKTFIGIPLSSRIRRAIDGLKSLRKSVCLVNFGGLFSWQQAILYYLYPSMKKLKISTFYGRWGWGKLRLFRLGERARAFIALRRPAKSVWLCSPHAAHKGFLEQHFLLLGGISNLLTPFFVMFFCLFLL